MQELIKYTGIGAAIILPVFLILWFAPIVAVGIAGLFGFLLISALAGMVVHGAWEDFGRDWFGKK